MWRKSCEDTLEDRRAEDVKYVVLERFGRTGVWRNSRTLAGRNEIPIPDTRYRTEDGPDVSLWNREFFVLFRFVLITTVSQ